VRQPPCTSRLRSGRSRFRCHSRLIAWRRVACRSAYSKTQTRPRVERAPEPALCWATSIQIVRPADVSRYPLCRNYRECKRSISFGRLCPAPVISIPTSRKIIATPYVARCDGSSVALGADQRTRRGSCGSVSGRYRSDRTAAAPRRAAAAAETNVTPPASFPTRCAWTSVNMVMRWRSFSVTADQER
jgi:hypothetical protein